MNEKVLESIIEITEQKNSLALSYSILVTLSELLPISSALLLHHKGPSTLLVARLDITLDSKGTKKYQWVYNEAYPNKEYQYAQTEIVFSQQQDGQYQCRCPIPIEENFSAELCLILREPAEPYRLLISGFARIYRNYTAILHESERDKLTGLLNRRTLEDRLHQTLSLHPSAKEEESKLWIAMLDIDHFKSINDRFGHMIGDEVLLMFAQQMQHYFGPSSLLFRFGGEEFVIVFSTGDEQHVYEQLEAFRVAIQNRHFPQVGALTFSAGFCSLSLGDYFPTMLDNADKALYFAKEHGRNQVHCYEHLCREGRIASPLRPFIDDVELF
ncbi:GGDEF domain-containing protein [Vibrio sp. IRLE0018]|uniref:GGDEF domain-containing protein n=1 Tax=Vibrio TaxID=662 RepID=UPI001594A07F|nr:MULTISPECIES: GGDEF domain-containing protein [Vibrio]MCF8777968.1 GGDEF domain-containing protein [Vibrio floridensis]NVC64895.1 GGDEF domain-containing protein [Vibrio sp. 05-20-BW147]HAS6347125.1 diguanylate cyclase [Vibrio vulnificus]